MQRPPAVRPAVPSRAAFLAAVSATGVGPPVRELTKRLADQPADATAPAVAHRLVVLGVLTRFQADRLLAGKTTGYVLGPYLILEPLGEDDGGRLFKARHRVMDRLVSVWLPAADGDPGRAAARLAAATQTARLAHPHVLTVLDVDDRGRRPYVVTEYVDGAGLDAVVRLAGRLPIGRACDLVRQVALAVAHAHEQGLAHGDLTVGSVQVGRPGGAGVEGRMAVKVARFGGGPATPEAVAADLGALGGLLLHLLVGRDGAGLPAGVPGEVAGLAAELLDPARRPTAAVAADRLAPFADPECGPVGVEVPAAACPFADLRVDQPIGSVTRSAPRGGWRRLFGR